MGARMRRIERPAARGHVVRARVEDALAPAIALRLIVISENRLYREGLAHLLGAQAVARRRRRRRARRPS